MRACAPLLRGAHLLKKLFLTWYLYESRQLRMKVFAHFVRFRRCPSQCIRKHSRNGCSCLLARWKFIQILRNDPDVILFLQKRKTWAEVTSEKFLYLFRLSGYVPPHLSWKIIAHPCMPTQLYVILTFAHGRI